jgi:hypothetical protein
MKRLLKSLKLKKVAKKNRIDFNGRLGLSVDGFLVSNFCYLLEWYSNGALNSFSDRSLLDKDKGYILMSIDADFKQSKLKEELRYTVSRATAKGNALNLKKIMISLTNYYKSET